MAVSVRHDRTSAERFVPRLVVEWELDGDAGPWRSVPGTLIFVDISGFTKLSEKLARRGRIGAEELTEVLGPRVRLDARPRLRSGAAASSSSGATPSSSCSAARTTRCRRLARRSRCAPRCVRLRRCRLRSDGWLSRCRSASTRSGRPVPRGRVAQRADHHRTDCQHRPLRWKRRPTPVRSSSAPAAPRRCRPGAARAAKGHGSLSTLAIGAPSALGIDPRRRGRERGSCSRPFPSRWRTPRRGWGRARAPDATVGFVKFKGVDGLLRDCGPDVVAKALDELVRCAQDAVDAEGVTFLATDIDADGGKIILTTGVPTTQEDDEGRMLRAVRASPTPTLPSRCASA